MNALTGQKHKMDYSSYSALLYTFKFAKVTNSLSILTFFVCSITVKYILNRIFEGITKTYYM